MLKNILQHKAFYYFLFLLFQLASFFSLSPVFQKHSLNVWSPKTVFDSYIPFWPFMVIPYMFYIPLLITPLFLSLEKKYLNLLAIQLFSASIINYACSFFISAQISSRAILTESSSHFFLKLVEYLYSVDVGSCLFPSMHVMHPLLISFCLWKIRHKLRGIILTAALGLSVSTVFVKQHFFLDSVAGVLFAWIIFYLLPIKALDSKHLNH